MNCVICNSEFTQKRKNQCTCANRECHKSRHASLKRSRRKLKPKRFGPCVSELYAEARGGCCVVCDRLAQGTTCGHPECVEVYEEAKRLDYNLRKNPHAGFRMEDLAESNRQILALSDNGISHREIAEQMGLKPNTVTKRLLRLRCA